MVNYSIRNFSEEDSGQVLELLEQLIAEDCDEKYFEGRWSDPAFYKENYLNASKGYYTLLAVMDRKPVGFLSGCSAEKSRMAEKDSLIGKLAFVLDIFYVSKGYRRNGVAGKMINKMLHDIKKAGFQFLVFDASNDNTQMSGLARALESSAEEYDDWTRYIART
jgi:ribosomal protein S18 acetylase RimI-like enzyme